MTPKEKAIELIDSFLEIEFQRGSGKFDGYLTIEVFEAKRCALIAVNEILSICPLPNRDYYEEIKKELQN